MDTRDKFIEAALKLFAEKGFYGASMDHIAREVGLTKQALIHHFRTKEKLYAAVLTRISARLISELGLDHDSAEGDITTSFADSIERIHQLVCDHPEDTQVLMRELLDNRRRAAGAGVWYLRPLLDGLQQRLAQEPAWREADPLQIAAHVYQLLGAINYYAVSTTTLQNMYSAEVARDMQSAFPKQLRRLANSNP